MPVEFQAPGPEIYELDPRRGTSRSASRSIKSTARPAMPQLASGGVGPVVEGAVGWLVDWECWSS